jgi:diguanylate cyclase (GGDEF)-like protein/PAS domain S-box-containing protein
MIVFRFWNAARLTRKIIFSGATASVLAIAIFILSFSAGQYDVTRAQVPEQKMPAGWAASPLDEEIRRQIRTAGPGLILAAAFAWLLWRTVAEPAARLSRRRDLMFSRSDNASLPREAPLRCSAPTTEPGKGCASASEQQDQVDMEPNGSGDIGGTSAHTGDGFVSMSHDGKVIEWNGKAEQIFGWHCGEVIGKELALLIFPPAFREQWRTEIRRISLHAQGPADNRRMEMSALSRQQNETKEISVESLLVPIKRDDQVIINAFFYDITESKAAQAKLIDSEQRLRDIADHLPALIGYFDKDLRYQFANATYQDWLGIPIATIIGRHVSEVLGPLYEDRRDKLQRVLTGKTVKFELASTSAKLGVKRHVETTYIPRRDASGAVVGIYTLSTDVSALRTAQEELALLARLDPLTGLANRRCFEEKFSEAKNRAVRSGKPLALIYLDIDKFKSINDTLGHAVGDEVLCKVAHKLKSTVRKTDTVARIAGDEFVIILESLGSIEEAGLISQKINAAIREPIELTGSNLAVSVSMGVVYDEQNTLPIQELMLKADDALYHAKAAGRDTYQIHVASSG